MSQKACGIDLRSHIGEFELDRLKIGDGPSELLPLFRVMQSRVVGALRHSHAKSGDADASPVEDLQRVDKSASGFAKKIPFGNPAILEDDGRCIARAQSELVFFFSG